MKFLVFGDPHITLQCEFGKPDSQGLTDYIRRVASSFCWISELVKEHIPDVVVCLGDLFESTGYVDTTSLSIAADMCSNLSLACSELDSLLFFIVGNHDIYSKIYNNLSFMSLDHEIKVVDHNLKYKLSDLSFQFIPWTEEEVIFDRECDLIFSHLLVKGGYLYKDKQSEKGVDCKYGENQVIFNGHHHRNQKLGKSFYNVGSLLSRTFQDVNSGNKGVYLYDTETKKAKFIVNPYEIAFKEIIIDSEKIADTVIHNISEGNLDYSSHYVRIKFDPKLKTQVDDISCFTKDCRLEAIQQKPDLDKSFVSDLFSIDENFKEYVLSLVEDNDECKEIIKLGLIYIEKVNKENDILHKLSLEFCNLFITNFQSIGNIRINLQNNGLVAIVGVNGSGKSSFLEAIYWVLTGDSLRGYKGDDVIKWGEENCTVTLLLKVGGEEYHITRKKERKKSYELHVDLSCSSNNSIRRSSDSEEVLNNLLGRTKDILKHSVFLTSDLSTKFTSLSYPDRVRLFEKITNLEMYAFVEKEVEKDVLEVKKNILSVESKVEVIQSTIANVDKSLDRIDEEIIEFSSTDFNIDKNKDLLKEYVKKLNLYRMQRIKLEEDRDKLKKKLYDSEKEHRDLLNKKEKVVSLKASIEKERSLLIKKRGEIEDLIQSNKCYVCGASTENSEYVNTELEAVYSSVDVCDNRIITCSNKVNKINSIILNVYSVGVKLQQEIDSLDEESKSLNRSNVILENKKDYLSDVLNVYLNKLSVLESRKSELEKVRVESNNKIVKYKVELDNFIKHLANLNFISKAFSTSGIRSVILEDIAINFINNRLEYYSEMVGFSCYLTNKVFTKSGDKRNKIDVKLDGKKIYKGCSRGEKRRIDLCIQCAINDLAIALGGSQINILIADEIIDPLDEKGVSGFINVLRSKYQSQSNATMLIVSHKKFFNELLDSSWIFTKDNGITSLEVKNV
jgi:DNA repair exonuclease SbcCD ATPase subunit